MNLDQILLVSLLCLSLVFFIIGIVRYDIVASFVLIFAVALGLVPFKNAFTGFSHSAIITIAAVFVISRSMENAGILSKLATYLRLRKKNISLQIAILCLVVIVVSAFINNTGAIELMIPVVLNIARVKNIPRGVMLMPLAFSALIGGTITSIGTPPNIIIATFRRNNVGEPFYFLDFVPVGVGIAIISLIFIALIGWRLIPIAKNKDKDVSNISEKFTVELKLHSYSSLVGKRLARIMDEYQGGFDLRALVRDGTTYKENLGHFVVNTDDILILETDKWTLGEIIEQYNLIVNPSEKKQSDYKKHYIAEVTILPNSQLANQIVKKLNLPEEHDIEIIALSRKGKTFTKQLSRVRLKAGDVLLIKSGLEITIDKMRGLNCAIVEEKRVRPFSKIDTIKVLSIFTAALVLVIMNLVRVDFAFFSAAILMIVTGCISLERAYRSINLPVILLIATLIPVGEAIETTGTATLIANSMYSFGQSLPIWVNLFILIFVCMMLSNLINNAAVALIFAPIALQIAGDWNASVNPFLMAVAIGASCVFLTPISHPANTLVMGPGNYRFRDYWVLGLPLTFVVSIAATFLIMFFWPFFPRLA